MATPTSNPFPIPTKIGRPQPSEAYMLEVTLDKSSSIFSFRYKQLWKEKFNGPTDKHQQFLKWISNLVQNPTAGTALSTFDATPGVRKPSKMSFNCKNLVYLVFKLDSEINWRFTADGPPISMDKFWENKAVFFDATNLDGLGEVTVPAKNNRFKYAFVIVDCPNGKPGNGPAIEARFNLHVDFVEGLGDADPYVPVIIDPDVRNPGGGSG